MAQAMGQLGRVGGVNRVWSLFTPVQPVSVFYPLTPSSEWIEMMMPPAIMVLLEIVLLVNGGSPFKALN